MFFCAALVILMIIKFRFPKGKTIHQVIERRYGRPLLNLFRKLENFDLKIRKSLCDIEFLNVCLENELTPKFLNFKLYRKDLKGCLDWDSFATFLRLFSDADALVRKRRDSFASTKVIELCWVRRVGSATQTRLSKAWTWTVLL